MGQAWKNLERKTAKLFGGKRNVRGGDFSQSVSDVLHKNFSIECKVRKNFPCLYEKYFIFVKPVGKILIVIHFDKVFLRLQDFLSIVDSFPGKIKREYLFVCQEKRKLNRFLEDSLRQAEGYFTEKIPLVVVKKARKAGEFVYMRKKDIERYLGEDLEEEK